MSVVEETEESVGTVRPRCTTKVSPSLPPPPPPCPPAGSEPGVAAAAVRGSPAGVEEGNFSANEGKRSGYKMTKGQKSNCETATRRRDVMQVAKSIRITGSGCGVLWLSANAV